MLNNVRQVYRRHGLVAMMKYSISRLLQRLMVLDVTHVMIQDSHDIESPKEASNIECRFLTPDEIRKFAADPLSDMSADMGDRIAGGCDFCFAGLIDGQLACYSWFALHSIEASNNRSTGSTLSGMAISFPEQFAFRYKGYTHPEFRGRRIYQHVAEESALAMKDKGVRYILSTAEWVNFGALKSSYRSGFEYRGLLFVAVIAGKRFVYYPSLSEQGIRFDADAEVVDRALLSPAERQPLGSFEEGPECGDNDWQRQCLPREEESFT